MKVRELQKSTWGAHGLGGGSSMGKEKVNYSLSVI
jgi:hypothetical protein